MLPVNSAPQELVGIETVSSFNLCVENWGRSAPEQINSLLQTCHEKALEILLDSPGLSAQGMRFVQNHINDRRLQAAEERMLTLEEECQRSRDELDRFSLTIQEYERELPGSLTLLNQAQVDQQANIEQKQRLAQQLADNQRDVAQVPIQAAAMQAQLNDNNNQLAEVERLQERIEVRSGQIQNSLDHLQQQRRIIKAGEEQTGQDLQDVYKDVGNALSCFSKKVAIWTGRVLWVTTTTGGGAATGYFCFKTISTMAAFLGGGSGLALGVGSLAAYSGAKRCYRYCKSPERAGLLPK